MKVFTVSNGTVELGARVEEVKIESAGFSFKAISVGERGRGRILATLPVDEKALNSSKEVAKVFNADLGKTKSGKTKLFKESNSNNESCIVVFRTDIGFRGGNNHTGDRTPETMESDDPKFLEFPGEILLKGVIAQGDAGRMGSGAQIIAIMPKGVVFRTSYYGRLYGAPSAHYYIFDGEKIIAVTWEERCSSDIF